MFISPNGVRALSIFNQETNRVRIWNSAERSSVYVPVVSGLSLAEESMVGFNSPASYDLLQNKQKNKEPKKIKRELPNVHLLD